MLKDNSVCKTEMNVVERKCNNILTVDVKLIKNNKITSVFSDVYCNIMIINQNKTQFLPLKPVEELASFSVVERCTA